MEAFIDGMLGIVCMLIIACMLYAKSHEANDDNWPSGGSA